MFDLGDRDFTDRTVTEKFERADVTLAVSIAESYYQVNKGKLPLPEDFELLKTKGYSEKKIVKLLKSKEYREGLARRGIAWPKEYDPTTAKAVRGLSPQQQFTVLVITDPTRNDSLRKRLESVGVTYTQYRNWMKNPDFANALTTLAEDMIGDVNGSVFSSVAAKAMSGDISAARLLLELNGRHDPAKQQMLDITRIIGLVLESLTRHVTDSVTLEKLGKDLDLILAGTTPQIEGPKPDFSFVQDIVDAEVLDSETDSEAAATPEPVPVSNNEDAIPAKRDSVTNTPKGFFDV